MYIRTFWTRNIVNLEVLRIPPLPHTLKQFVQHKKILVYKQGPSEGWQLIVLIRQFFSNSPFPVIAFVYICTGYNYGSEINAPFNSVMFTSEFFRILRREPSQHWPNHILTRRIQPESGKLHLSIYVITPQNYISRYTEITMSSNVSNCV